MEAGKFTQGSGDGSRVLARSVDQAESGAHQAVDKVTGAVRPAMDRMASGAHVAIDRIADVAGNAAVTIGEKSGQLKNAQVRALEHSRGFVRDHPLAVLGAAVAVGFVLSRLISLR